LHANKKNEQIKMKNPFLVAIVFILSVIILGYAYYKVTTGATTIEVNELLFVIFLGGIGTFLLFWSLSGMLLRIFMSFKKTYYKNLNMFVLRQVSSKVNTTVFSMSVISIMLFLTIGILSSALSLKNSMTSNLKKLAPIDFQVMKYVDTSIDRTALEYTDVQLEDSKLSIRETLNRLDINVDNTFTDIVEFSTYQTEELTLRVSIGEEIKKVTEQYRFLQVDTKEDIMKISDYNRLAKLFQIPTYELNENEYIIVADFDSMVEVRNPSLKRKTPITMNGKTYLPKYEECKDGFFEISSNHINTGLILVPDDAVRDDMKAKNYFAANYKETTEEGKDKTEEFIMEQTKNHPYKDSTRMNGMTKDAIYTASVGLGAMATFIGIYLGIIFLISSAAILALKELSESSDNKDRYQILRRIGTDERMIRHALFTQIAIFFLVPLLVAIIHSIFGIQFANKILETFGNEQLLPSIIMTATFLIAIYGGYFIITYLCSKNIISEK
ncbi:MAG: ABC transporter permease, partial [Firmicutes bacterium]|nr:ABC transporter permease [Bacillota bacterium]